MHVGREGYELKALQVSIDHRAGFETSIKILIVVLFNRDYRLIYPRRSTIIPKRRPTNPCKVCTTSLHHPSPLSIRWPPHRTAHPITNTQHIPTWQATRVEPCDRNARQHIAIEGFSLQTTWLRRGARKDRRWIQIWTTSHRRIMRPPGSITTGSHSIFNVASHRRQTNTTRETLQRSHPMRSLLSTQMTWGHKNLTRESRQTVGALSKPNRAVARTTRELRMMMPIEAFPHRPLGRSTGPESRPRGMADSVCRPRQKKSLS